MKSLTAFSPFPARRAAGFSLVEVTLALGIAAFCLVVLLGILPAGINTNQASLEQTAAAGLAAGVVADLRATPKTAGAVSPRYGFAADGQRFTLTNPATIYLSEDGSATGTVGAKPVFDGTNPPARYRVSLSFVDPPNPAPAKGPTAVRLLVTWPAQADANPAKAPAGYAGALEVVTALDRN